MEHLVHLDLSCNRVSRISGLFFGRVPQLEVLNLNFNSLEFLDSKFEELRRLKQLSVVGNRLVRLPKFLVAMKSLRTVEIEWPFLAKNCQSLHKFLQPCEVPPGSFHLPIEDLSVYFLKNSDAGSLDFFEYSEFVAQAPEQVQKRTRDILMACIRLNFFGLFEHLFATSSQQLRASKEFLLSAFSTALEVRNYNALVTVANYIEQRGLKEVYGESRQPLHLAMSTR